MRFAWGGAGVQDVVLRPLSRDDLRQMLVECLHCEPGAAEPLAALVHDKTTGNPFFAIQFVRALADEGLLTFDYSQGQWRWDLLRIRAKNITDNVVELMVAQLGRMPPGTQQALQQFACLGNSAAFDVLRVVCRAPVDAVHDGLWDAVQSGLIFRGDDSYRFLHDRVQEAAYSTIPADLRAEATCASVGFSRPEGRGAALRCRQTVALLDQLPLPPARGVGRMAGRATIDRAAAPYEA